MKIHHSLSTIILFLLIGFQSIYSQEKINQLNANGERVGIWKKFHNNNRIRYEGQFEAGKEVGVFNYYSALNSDHPTVIKTFSKSSNKATIQFFTEKGVLESEGEMNGKNRIGKWFYFHPDGKSILSEENYENGVLNGEAKTYYLKGELTEISHFKNGKLHGNLKRYADNSVLLDDLNYENGKLHGAAKYYNIDGKLILWGNYENDEKVGEWEYFKNGKPKNFDKEKK